MKWIRIAGPLLLATAAVAADRAVVLQPVLSMYSKPTRDADVVSQAIYATTVEIVASEGAWSRIRTPDDYQGWSQTDGLRPLAAAEKYPAAARAAMVESLFSHLYRESSVTRHEPMLTVPFETTLEIIDQQPRENPRWYGVRLPDDRKAWAQAGDLTFDTAPRDIPALIALAKRFLGFPYTWGGTSSYGYDCSGFTQMLCRRGGTLLPRDAKPQALWEKMQPVDRAALEPGDLLYFGASVEKISHTGFYIGGGEFIHSTTNTRPIVQVSRLADENWTKLLVACRRWRKP